MASSRESESLRSQAKPGASTGAQPPSPLADALAAVGDRWSLQLIAVLLDGPLRFGELQERLADIAPNVLAQRLRALEQQRLVVAQPYSERPPRFLYELTAAGLELSGALRLLTDWGARHGAGVDASPRHTVCGGTLEARWYCPTCQEPVAEPGGDSSDGDGLLYA
jgi:DNA-binding HxlR family transcriptional regulator